MSQFGPGGGNGSFVRSELIPVRGSANIVHTFHLLRSDCANNKPKVIKKWA